MSDEVNADLVARLIGDEREPVGFVAKFSEEFLEDGFDETTGAMIRSMIVNKTFGDLPLCPCCDDGDPA